jgi:hypothetical protein
VTPNSSTNNIPINNGTNHIKNPTIYSDAFDFGPVFIPNSDGLNNSSHNDNYFGFPANFNLAGNPGDPITGHVVPSQSGEMDQLGALLSMYNFPVQQQQQPHAGHWSNQTTPELNSVGHGSPTVNPITSAIDQSMANINTVPPAMPSAWDTTNYSPFAYLPPLYPTGSIAKESVTSVSDVPSVGAHPLLTGINFGVTHDMSVPTQPMKQQIDPEVVRKQIFYYFNRVRKMQYCLAGETTKDVLRDLVVSDSHVSRLPRDLSRFSN